MFLKIYFDNLSIKDKAILYILPIVIVLYYNYIVTSHTEVNFIKKPDLKINKVDVTNRCENILKKNHLRYSDIHFNNDILNIKLNGTLKNIVNFIQMNRYLIRRYQVIKNNKGFELDIIIDISKMVKDYKIYYNYKHKSTKQKIKVKAIIENYVLINKRWYHIDEGYKQYQIVIINNNSVEFKSDNETKIIKVIDEQKLK